jgi:hypothetical protein
MENRKTVKAAASLAPFDQLTMVGAKPMPSL